MIGIDLFSNPPPSLKLIIINKRKNREETLQEHCSVCHRMTENDWNLGDIQRILFPGSLKPWEWRRIQNSGSFLIFFFQLLFPNLLRCYCCMQVRKITCICISVSLFRENKEHGIYEVPQKRKWYDNISHCFWASVFSSVNEQVRGHNY